MNLTIFQVTFTWQTYIIYIQILCLIICYWEGLFIDIYSTVQTQPNRSRPQPNPRVCSLCQLGVCYGWPKANPEWNYKEDLKFRSRSIRQIDSSQSTQNISCRSPWSLHVLSGTWARATASLDIRLSPHRTQISIFAHWCGICERVQKHFLLNHRVLWVLWKHFQKRDLLETRKHICVQEIQSNRLVSFQGSQTKHQNTNKAQGRTISSTEAEL